MGINWDTHSVLPDSIGDTQNFYDCVQDGFLEQHVLEPTRKRGVNDPSTLDLIFTKSELEIDHLEYLAPLGASDHATLSFSFILEGAVATEFQGAPKFNYWN